VRGSRKAYTDLHAYYIQELKWSIQATLEVLSNRRGFSGVRNLKRKVWSTYSAQLLDNTMSRQC
jgi:hypothetical protein